MRNVTENRKQETGNIRKSYLSRVTCHLSPAFTLIELLIAITIIAILIGAGTYTWTNGQQKGRDGRRKEDLKQVQNALELYAHVNGQYPAASAGNIKCNADGDTTTVISWGSEFKCGIPTSTTYMQKLPKDPKITNRYKYVTSSSGGKITGYALWATLENTSSNNPDYCNGSVDCALKSGIALCGNWVSPYNYCVGNP